MFSPNVRFIGKDAFYSILADVGRDLQILESEKGIILTLTLSHKLLMSCLVLLNNLAYHVVIREWFAVEPGTVIQANPSIDWNLSYFFKSLVAYLFWQ